jgi:hypothetical protein
MARRKEQRIAAWIPCDDCGAVLVRIDPADVSASVRCQACTETLPPERVTEEEAYQMVKTWFVARYEDPVEQCPFESAEGGYQFIYGAPYTATAVLTAAWSMVLTTSFVRAAAQRLEQEYDCYAWSAVPHDNEEQSYD